MSSSSVHRIVVRRSSSLVALVVGSILATTASPATAQGNYRMAPVGGRTTLVGGTGLAFGRDSASSFMNPATIVRVDAGRLAFSVNFYALSLVTADKWYQPGPIDRARFGDVQRASASISSFDFDPLSGSLCVFLRMSDIPLLARAASKDLRERQARLGLCFANIQSDTYAFSADDYVQTGSFGQTRQSGSIRKTFRRLAAGPSYAMYIDDHWALGASLHMSFASFRSSASNSATTTVTGAPEPINSGFFANSRGDSQDLSWTLGTTYRMGNQTVALAVEGPSLHLFGVGGLSTYAHYDGAGGSGATISTDAHGSFSTPTPLRVALGTGYEAAWGSAELNVSMHVPIKGAYEAKLTGHSFEKDGSAPPVDRSYPIDVVARPRGVVNIGVGGELFLTPKVSLLAGLSTDLSAVPKGALGKDPMTFYSSSTNRVAASCGYGSHGEGGDLLIGGELSYGWGERLSVNPYQLPPRLDPTDERTYALLVVIAGSTTFKTIKRAVEEVTNVLDPKEDAKKPRETEKMKTDRQADDPKTPVKAEPPPTSPTPAPTPTPAPAPAPEDGKK